jgi:outer membrane immunogenic protein
MKKFLLATIAAAALVAAGPAMAADMGAPVYKAPPPPAPAPVYNWTGFYVGAGAGYGMWDMDTTTTFPAVGVASSVTNNGGRGWVGQAVAGYDYQFPVASFNLVAGVFGDYDFGHISGTTNVGLAVSPVDTFGGVEKERSSWAVGGRLGWLITPQILTYWNGGYTEARFDGINLTDTGVGIAGPLPPLSVTANTYHGWFTGGGVETQVRRSRDCSSTPSTAIRAIAAPPCRSAGRLSPALPSA